MSTNNVDIIIKAKDDATATIKKVDKSVSNLDKSVSSMAPSWTKIGAIAVGALAGIGYGAMKAVKAYNEVEVINKKLEHAVLAVSHGTREQMQALSDLADEAERKGVVDADNVRLGQAQLSTFGLQTETVKKLTASLVDLTVNQSGATATGADFEASANTIAKALNGQFGILEKSGIRFSEAQKAIIEHGSESQKAAAIQEGFAQNLKYTNEIAATTAEGGMARMNVAIGNVQESIGEALQPAVIEVTNAIANLAEKISAWFQDNKTQVNNTMHYIGAGFWLLVNLVGNTWNALATTIATAIVVVMQTIVNIANAGIKAWNVFASVVGAKWVEPLKWFENAAVKGAVMTGNAWSKLGSNFSSDFANITAGAKKTGDAIGGGGGWAGTGLSGSIGKASKQAEELGKKAEEALKKVLDKSKDGEKAIADIRDKIAEATQKWKEYKNEGLKALREVRQEIANLQADAGKIQLNFGADKNAKLGARMVEVLKEIQDINSDMSTEEDGNKREEMQKKLNALMEEEKYIKEQASQTAIDEAKKYAELSESQRIVVDLEKEKGIALDENKKKMDALIEKRMVLEAQANQKALDDQRIFTEEKDGLLTASIIDEKGKKIELHDQEAINLAFEVEQKQKAMSDEMEALNTQLADKLTAQQSHLADVTKAYDDFNKNLKEETKATAVEMIATLAGVNKALQETIALKAKAGMGNSDTTVQKVDWARARGWDVEAGKTYMVGEQGVELFTPDRNGSIIPNDKLGAGPTSVTNNFGGITINDRGDVDYFMEKLARVMQLGKLWIT